jgi:hypothetical protein
MPSRASAGSEMMNQVVPMMWVLTTRPYLSGKGKRKSCVRREGGEFKKKGTGGSASRKGGKCEGASSRMEALTLLIQRHRGIPDTAYILMHARA